LKVFSLLARSPLRLNGIESIRGYAACFVIILHSTAIFPAPVPQWFLEFRSFLTLGVPLFFVVSAFSLAYGYEEKLDSPQQIKAYFLRRFLE
jgi:peptidoglycan/LPS O-acetylase OafA/YrhL